TLEALSLSPGIQRQFQSELDRTQREYVLRQQLEAIRKELGEFDESAEEASGLRRQLDEGGLRGGGRRACAASSRRPGCRRRSAGRPSASSSAWSPCRRRRPSTASSAH